MQKTIKKYHSILPVSKKANDKIGKKMYTKRKYGYWFIGTRIYNNRDKRKGDK